ncbi:MAG: hypothetical protein HRT71_17555 [Flavobacteriales bacterium]|nr:hypothetical protein [Flavobacteriales bacterium]
MIPQKDRIVVLDALRGFALVGIFVVNIFCFHMYYGYTYEFHVVFEGLDELIYNSMLILCGGKFMFIFAFLFGFGAWLQYSKYSDFSAFKSFWLRRMSVLFFSDYFIFYSSLMATFLPLM